MPTTAVLATIGGPQTIHRSLGFWRDGPPPDAHTVGQAVQVALELVGWWRGVGHLCEDVPGWQSPLQRLGGQRCRQVRLRQFIALPRFRGLAFRVPLTRGQVPEFISAQADSAGFCKESTPVPARALRGRPLPAFRGVRLIFRA